MSSCSDLLYVRAGNVRKTNGNREIAAARIFVLKHTIAKVLLFDQ